MSTKTPPLVVLAGNLGAGKTTLARRLGEHFDWWIGYESVSDNPYLDDFYADMAKWAFHLQIYFLGNRVLLHKTAETQPAGAVLDRSIFEDRHIFAAHLREQESLTKRDHESYTRLHDIAVASLRVPSLVLYVTAPPAVLQERIRRRGQPFDRGLSLEYLTAISAQYERWIGTLPRGLVLQVDSTTMDFANDGNASPRMSALFKEVARLVL